MEDDRVESDTIEKAERKREFVELIENGSSNFNNCKFCRLGWVGRGGEDTKVSLDLTLGANRIQ